MTAKNRRKNDLALSDAASTYRNLIENPLPISQSLRCAHRCLLSQTQNTCPLGFASWDQRGAFIGSSAGDNKAPVTQDPIAFADPYVCSVRSEEHSQSLLRTISLEWIEEIVRRQNSSAQVLQIKAASDVALWRWCWAPTSFVSMFFFTPKNRLLLGVRKFA